MFHALTPSNPAPGPYFIYISFVLKLCRLCTSKNAGFFLIHFLLFPSEYVCVHVYSVRFTVVGASVSFKVKYYIILYEHKHAKYKPACKHRPPFVIWNDAIFPIVYLILSISTAVAYVVAKEFQWSNDSHIQCTKAIFGLFSSLQLLSVGILIV